MPLLLGGGAGQRGKVQFEEQVPWGYVLGKYSLLDSFLYSFSVSWQPHCEWPCSAAPSPPWRNISQPWSKSAFLSFSYSLQHSRNPAFHAIAVNITRMCMPIPTSNVTSWNLILALLLSLGWIPLSDWQVYAKKQLAPPNYSISLGFTDTWPVCWACF